MVVHKSSISLAFVLDAKLKRMKFERVGSSQKFQIMFEQKWFLCPPDFYLSLSLSLIPTEAEEMAGYKSVDWLSVLPKDHAVDYVIGHGTDLGRQVQIIKRHHDCKWVQVVYNVPEELGAYKYYPNAISRADKMQQVEVKLCEKADQVVAVGPKVTEVLLRYLRKDQEHVFNLTPGILSDFANVQQATEEMKKFRVLLFGQYCMEDFYLKGYDIAACAIAELKIEPQPYTLLFAGAPSEEQEKMTDLFLKKGVERTQLFFRPYNGSREQLARLFCEVDLAIMPPSPLYFLLLVLLNALL